MFSVAGYCSECAVSFYDTDDAHDTKQTFSTTRPAFRGIEEGILGGGFVKEMRSFFNRSCRAAKVGMWTGVHRGALGGKCCSFDVRLLREL